MLHFFLLFVLAVSVKSRGIKKDPCGIEASPNALHQNPWLVYLEYYRGEEAADVKCAATLIDSRHLLTAAHCVVNTRFNRITARLGEFDVRTDKDCVDGVCSDEVIRIDVDSIIIHPDYDGAENDIAVLRLIDDAPYTDFIRPICLPSGDFNLNSLFIASGWGKIPFHDHYSPTKKTLLLPFWDRNSCIAAFKKVPETVFCAGGKKGEDTCDGDSGGPLVLKKGVAELKGVTSAGSSVCGTENLPGFYTDVKLYLDWINIVLYDRYT